MKKDNFIKELLKLRKEKKLAETKGRHKEQADYCNTIGVLLSDHGDYEGALAEHQEELTLCQQQEDSMGVAVAHRKLGEALCELGRVKEALAHHTRFLEAAQRQNNRLELQRATATVGRTYLMMAENESSQSTSKVASLEKAQKWFQKSLKIVPSVPGLSDKEGAEMTARLHINLGIVADTGDKPKEAREQYTKATAITDKLSLLEDGRRVHDLLALNLQSTGDYRSALQHLDVALKLAERLHDKAARADTLNTRAQVLIQMGEPDGASRAWYKAYKLKSPNPDDHEKHARCLRYAMLIVRYEDRLALLSVDDHQGRCSRHEKLGDWYCHLSAHRQALEHYMQQLKCAERLGRSEAAIAPIYASIAVTHKDMKQLTESAHWYRRELAARKGNLAEMCETLMNLADLEASIGGGVSSVCELYRQAADVAAEAGLARQRAFALRDMAITYAENGMPEDEERVRRDLSLALKCDGLPEDWDEESEEVDSQGSGQGSQQSHQGSDEEIDIDNLSDMSSECDDEAHPDRPRRVQAARRPWKQTNSKGETPLHLACMQGKHKQAEKLLQQGHPVNPRDYSGWLPIHEAANFGYLLIVNMLIERGARVSDRGGAHCGGVTPLHDAAGNGHVEVARALLAAGADPTVKNDQGETPLEYLITYRSKSDDGLTPEAAADLLELENEIKRKLQNAGQPIPGSPSVRLLQSPSVRASRSPAASVEQESESPAAAPPVVLSDDEDADVTTAYRRAIRAVGKSALSATPATKRQLRCDSPETPGPYRSGLVGQDEYDWLEEDVPTGPPRRRRRRLSPDFHAASSSRSRARSPSSSPPPPARTVIPVSPLRSSQEVGSESPPSPVPQRCSRQESSQSREGSSSPLLGRQNQEPSSDMLTSDPLPTGTEDNWAPVDDYWPSDDDVDPIPRPRGSPSTRRGSEPDSPSPERSGASDPVIEVASSEEEVTPVRTRPRQGQPRKRPRQTRLTPLVMQGSRSACTSRSGRDVSPSRSSAQPAKVHRAGPPPTLTGRQAAASRVNVSTPRTAAAATATAAVKGGWFSPTLRVFVEVGRDRLMVPIPGDGRDTCTIGWLSQQASERYYRQFLLRPHLELCTLSGPDRPSVPLDSADAVRDVISGPDDVIGSRVTGWDRPPLTERYAAACATLKTRGVAAISSQLSVCQSSGRLDLCDLCVTPDRLRPVLRAVQRYSSVVHLNLSGNPLMDDGVQELSGALSHLYSLETLDLSLVKMTLVGLRHLSGAVSNRAALQGCRSLTLAYNLLSDCGAGRHLASIVAELPQLTCLDLSSCQLTADHVIQHRKALARALDGSYLSDLRVSHNPDMTSALAALLRLVRADRLRRLHVSGCHLRAEALPALTGQHRACALQHLQMTQCGVTDGLMTKLYSAFSQMRHLAHLDMSENPELTSAGIASLLSATLKSSCPLSELLLAGCSPVGQLHEQLLLRTAGPAAQQLRQLSLPAGEEGLCEKLSGLWTETWGKTAVKALTADGDLVLSVADA